MATTPPAEAPVRVVVLVDVVHHHAAGAERFAAALAGRLARDGFEVTLCTSRKGSGGPVVDAAAADGVSHLDLARGSRWDIWRFARLIRFLHDERIDVVHGQKFGSNVWGVICGRIARVPALVAHEHSWSFKGQPLRRFVDRCVIGPLCDAIVSVSDADRARMIAIEHINPEKIHTIPTAYLPRNDVPTGDVRAELGLSPDTPLVGTLATLRPQKALSVLLDAMALVHRAIPEARLVIAGTGQCEEDLRSRAVRLGIADVVHFIGQRQDADAVWQALDVAAMSSDFEGMPLAAIEAMINGAPLVATSVGGLPELVTDGVSGLLVPPRDPEALAGAIERLLRDPTLRRSIADAARVRARDYTLENVSRKTEALYRSLLDRAEARRGRSLRRS